MLSNHSSPVNPYATPGVQTITSIHGDKMLSVDLDEWYINIALDMPQYQSASTLQGGHRCGAFALDDAFELAQAIIEAVNFTKSAKEAQS